MRIPRKGGRIILEVAKRALGASWRDCNVHEGKFLDRIWRDCAGPKWIAQIKLGWSTQSNSNDWDAENKEWSEKARILALHQWIGAVLLENQVDIRINGHQGIVWPNQTFHWAALLYRYGSQTRPRATQVADYLEVSSVSQAQHWPRNPLVAREFWSVDARRAWSLGACHRLWKRHTASRRDP